MSQKSTQQSQTQSELDLWMIRPCRAYLEEYKECKSFKSRFHQHYIYGHNLPCEQWKIDHDNCLAYRTSRSEAAAEKVIQSEHERKRKRLAASRANDVWEYRRSPPDDWKKPLPEYLERMKLPSVNKQSSSGCCIS